MKGRQMWVSFAQGVQGPCFPILSGGLTKFLTGLYQYIPGTGPVLRVETGPPGMSDVIEFHFHAPQGDRLRYAEPWDAVGGIMVTPHLVSGGEYVDWLQHVSSFKKADTELEAFLKANPLEA